MYSVRTSTSALPFGLSGCGKGGGGRRDEHHALNCCWWCKEGEGGVLLLPPYNHALHNHCLLVDLPSFGVLPIIALVRTFASTFASRSSERHTHKQFLFFLFIFIFSNAAPAGIWFVLSVKRTHARSVTSLSRPPTALRGGRASSTGE